MDIDAGHNGLKSCFYRHHLWSVRVVPTSHTHLLHVKFTDVSETQATARGADLEKTTTLHVTATIEDRLVNSC